MCDSFFIPKAITESSFSSLSLCARRDVTQTLLTLVSMSSDRMTTALSAWVGLISSTPSIKTVIFPLFCNASLSRFLLMSEYFDSVNAAPQRNSTRESKLNFSTLISCNFLV